MVFALLEESDVPWLLPRKPRRFNDRTVVDRVELLAQLEDARRSRIAISLEEHHVDICAIATGITGPAGVLQSVVVVVPAQRLRTKAEFVIAALRKRQIGRHGNLFVPYVVCWAVTCWSRRGDPLRARPWPPGPATTPPSDP